MSETDSTLSAELGTPLNHADYTLGDLNRKLQRNPKAVADGLIWTAEQWKWFLPKNDENHSTPGYNPNIWYAEAIRKLQWLAGDIVHEVGAYGEPDTYGLDPEYAGLAAVALEYYEAHYDPLRTSPDVA